MAVNNISQFLTEAAEDSRYHAGHWFRYLRKVFRDESSRINQDDLEKLLDNEKLTMFQRITLKRAACPNTPTNRYVYGLNQRTTTPMLMEIIKRKYDD